ncbi:MAG: hypothetical protein EOO81_10935 [Oxalobacteraceae bacterium]|nr:MAG: hypothetical protein EOO81_10935 [Oxalobacteraceae bacterium]
MGLISIPPTSFSNFVAGWSFGFFFSLWAIAIGVVPVCLYGAPLYAWARTRGYASILTAVAIGSLPGLVLFAINRDTVVLLFGSLVGLCTHAFVRRQMGANNSFKPNPLRGSA